MVLVKTNNNNNDINDDNDNEMIAKLIDQKLVIGPAQAKACEYEANADFINLTWDFNAFLYSSNYIRPLLLLLPSPSTTTTSNSDESANDDAQSTIDKYNKPTSLTWLQHI
eukprot:UN10126